MAQKHLQLLRNTTPYANYEAAKAGILDAAPSQDGVPVLARYYYGEAQDGQDVPPVRTLLGLVYFKDGNRQVTILDAENNIDENTINNLIEQYVNNNLNAEDTPVAGQFVTAVTMESGETKVERAAVSANQVSFSEADYTATTVDAAIKELQGKVQEGLNDLASATTEQLETLDADSRVTLENPSNLQYVIYQGDPTDPTNKIGEINIPKDTVVSEGEIITADGTELNGTSASATSANLTAGEKYVKLTLANADETRNLIYIAVTDLVDVYTGSSGNVVNILVDDYTISASVNDGSITGDKIAQNTISGSNIADGAVDTAQIADGAITEDKIEDGAVTTDKIADDAITSDKIEDGAVGTDQIADSAITTDKIADSAITSDKIEDGAITEDKIEDGAITTDKIADSAITEDKIADSAITSDKIADGAITADKLDSAITANMETYLSGVTVNGVSGTVTDRVAEVTIYTDNLVVGSGAPDADGEGIVTEGAQLNQILKSYEDKIISATSGTLQTVKFNEVLSTEESEGTVARLRVDSNDLLVGTGYTQPTGDTAYTGVLTSDTVSAAISRIEQTLVDNMLTGGFGIDIANKIVNVKLSQDPSKQIATGNTKSMLEFDSDGGLYVTGIDAGEYLTSNP